jgi:hypothetical protein
LYIFNHQATKGKKKLDAFLKSVGTRRGADAFELLQDYAIYLQSTKVKPNQVRALVKAAKKFLRFCGTKIDNEDFKDRVTLPKQTVPDLQGTEKRQIVELLNSCKSQRLKTAILLIGATGCRPVEACSVKLSDIDFEHSMITFPAEYTKTKVERRRPMTGELAKQLQTWLKFKYSPHWNVRVNGKREYVEPKPDPDDLVLAHWHQNEKPKPEGIYDTIEDEYGELARVLNIGRKNGRRVLTLKSLRAWVKTTISDLGYSDYSEWFIGHSGSTYYRKPEKEILEIFSRIEPYLTFLDTTGVELKQASLEKRLEKSEENYNYLLRIVQRYANQNTNPMTPREQKEYDRWLAKQYEREQSRNDES